MTLRSVTKVFTAAPSRDGDGVDLRRAFPAADLKDLDPFLLLDHLGPTPLGPGEARGFPPHPHRGFETVTYLLEGEIEHRDSWGNHGTIRPGDVQWMTAGSGLVHSELPGETLLREGGTLHGFQLWVNLPKLDKMTPPRYQDTPAASIPVVRNAEGTVSAKVVAGETLGVKGVIDTRIPILYLHLTLQPGARFEQAIPKTSNALVYVIEGAGQFDEIEASAHQVAVFDRGGEGVRIANPGPSRVSLLLLAGEPIGQPVARYGPFVMNSKEELLQAVDDYQQGRMGVLG
ncbi:MAG: pirin family protein [Candidatus Solibacter sp.]|nr:pirin family protein [Candidatus Solibacter sp.]